MARIQMGNWDDEKDQEQILEARRRLVDQPVDAIKDLEHYANNGSIKATILAADTYMRGRYLPRDFEKAEFWFSKAGDLGIVFGRHMEADMQARLSKEVQARQTFAVAADKGFLPSIYRLGYMTAEGRGGDRDLERALSILKSAMSRGHWGARLYYASLLMRGRFGIIWVPFGIAKFALTWLLLLIAVVLSGGRLTTEWNDTYLL